MSDEPGKLLVVDDNEMNRDMLSRRLSRKGYNVDTAPDGHVALEMIDQQSFDLILLDIMMPGINGMEVLRTVRQTRSASDLPIIMATAKSESEDVVEALKLGANDYVTKPLDFPVVLARVNTHFQLKRAKDELNAAHTRMKQDLEAAARVQQTLLPAELPETDNAKFAWAYRPCDELAGDSLNVFRINDQLIGLYVLDVSGHGVPAALLSVTVTRRLSRHGGEFSLVTTPGSTSQEISPAEMTSRLNSLYPMRSNGGHYFTLMYGILDTFTREFRFVCAGHPGPILTHPDKAAQQLQLPALPVGVMDEAAYEDTLLELQPGDRLYVYSDGLNEETNSTGEQFGYERLLEAIADGKELSLEDSIDSVIAKVIGWHGKDHLKDDVSILAMEITQTPAR
jgi:sigma-B regulation protein RsbU (phosphoserine phosphatase)